MSRKAYKQLWGSVALDDDGKPTRSYETLDADTHYSDPWSMDGYDMISLELDTSEGGLLIASALTIQRSNVPVAHGGIKWPLETDVRWYDVPEEEATLILPNADGLADIYEWDFSAAMMYRVKMIVSTEGEAFGSVALTGRG